jgi:hypothetical protein
MAQDRIKEIRDLVSRDYGIDLRLAAWAYNEIARLREELAQASAVDSTTLAHARDCARDGHHPSLRSVPGTRVSCVCFYCDATYGDPSEIAQLRADLAALNRALADERAAVAIAHERIAEVTAELDEAIEDRRQARDDAARAAALLAVRTMELDNARSRVVEQIKKSLPHAMQNAKAVYKYDVNESRARAMAVLIVDEAIQCLHFDDTRESIRAHAAGSGKGGDNA